MAAEPGLAPGSIIGGIYKIRRLIGQGGMGEVYAAEARGGEKVELEVGEAPGIRARGSVIVAGKSAVFVVTITNDAPEKRNIEIRLPSDARGAKLVKFEGSMLWRARVPANGRAELRYTLNR